MDQLRYGLSEKQHEKSIWENLFFWIGDFLRQLHLDCDLAPFHLSRLSTFSTFHTQRSTLNVPHSTFHTQRSTLNVPHSTFHTQRSTLNVPHSTFHTQRSTLNVPHSTFHTQRSTLNVPHLWRTVSILALHFKDSKRSQTLRAVKEARRLKNSQSKIFFTMPVFNPSTVPDCRQRFMTVYERCQTII
jgi:hypothetical protein